MDEWLEHAPPKKGAEHWRAGRSAMELARRWVGGAVPPEVDALLRAHFDAPLAIDLAIAEETTTFDAYGGPRCHDMVVVGDVGTRRTLVAVEGKADEEFDRPVAGKLAAALRLPSTNFPERVSGLAEALVGQRWLDRVPPPGHPILRLDYQLLAATAGTLVAAADRKCARAILLVHEFRSQICSPKKLERNRHALAAYVSWLAGIDEPFNDAALIGPIKVFGAGKVPADVEFYIAKAVAQVGPS